MNKNYYDILGVNKSANESEIKKAYKKKAMEYHPDRNKWDKNAEAKFKEINEAYQTLSDTTKKKNYDQFGSAEWNPFGGMGWGKNPYGESGFSGGWGFGGFEDIFSQFGNGGRQTSGIEFDLGDILGGMWNNKQRRNPEPEAKKEIPNLDVTETIEIPIFEFFYDTSVHIRTIYGKNLSLKVKAGTKPGTKYKISGKWRIIDGKTGDMYVIVDAKMPTEIPKNLMPMIDALRSQLL